MLKNIKIKNSFSCLLLVFLTLNKLKLSSSTNLDKKIPTSNFTVCLSQKLHNTKGTISLKKNESTFSIGTVSKLFKIKQGKYIRRSLKGTKIFLNFLKNILTKKYKVSTCNGNFFFKISGFDYNLLFYKSFYKNLYKTNKFIKMYMLFNIKVAFTKKKSKRIKAIKKRLKKKILLNFLKNVK